MKLILFLVFLGLLPSILPASVTLVSFDGTQYPTANSAWTMTGNTTVVSTLMEHEGFNVLQLVDAGGGSSTTDFLNITKSLNEQTISNLFANGWEYRFTLKMGEETSEAWIPDANTFATMTWYDSAAATRKYHTLQFGRNVAGQTLVTVSGSTADVKTLSAGYHEYAMIYKPGSNTTELWIDNELWKNLTPVNTTGTASYVSWGDNSNQASPRTTPRYSYFTNVSLVMTPEPTVSAFLMLGSASLMLRRRR